MFRGTQMVFEKKLAMTGLPFLSLHLPPYFLSAVLFSVTHAFVSSENQLPMGTFSTAPATSKKQEQRGFGRKTQRWMRRKKEETWVATAHHRALRNDNQIRNNCWEAYLTTDSFSIESGQPRNHLPPSFLFSYPSIFFSLSYSHAFKGSLIYIFETIFKMGTMFQSPMFTLPLSRSPASCS